MKYQFFIFVKNIVPDGGSARIWTSASIWGVKSYFWCPSGIPLFAGLTYYRPVGQPYPGSYLASVSVKNISGAKPYEIVDEKLSYRSARVACEEY